MSKICCHSRPQTNPCTEYQEYEKLQESPVHDRSKPAKVPGQKQTERFNAIKTAMTELTAILTDEMVCLMSVIYALVVSVFLYSFYFNASVLSN